MSIFNSLGSNYDFNFAVRSLVARNKKEDELTLKKILEEKYKGQTTIVYKGREAIRLALRACHLRGATVAVCGFTCFAVYEAIVKEGYGVEYLDIDKDTLNFSFAIFEKAVKSNPNIKIVIIQNTLGHPCDIEKISDFCRQNNIILIEDLAHSVGTKYLSGEEAGSIGDFVVFSFSQDKMIDAEAGGAFIIKNSNFKLQNYELENISREQEFKDRFYPFFTVLIRKTYGVGVGKIIHYLLKKANLLSTPVERRNSSQLYKLAFWHSSIALNEIKKLEKNLKHRKKIAATYSEYLDEKIISKKLQSAIQLSSNLRFPIFTENRKGLIIFLKKHNIYISDIWYDAPIAPKKYLHKTDYVLGKCPNAEKVSETILNLPTHANVSVLDAKLIAEKVNIWLKSQ